MHKYSFKTSPCIVFWEEAEKSLKIPEKVVKLREVNKGLRVLPLEDKYQHP